MQAFSKMKLITREEFDIQALLLEQSLKKLESLEKRLEELEELKNSTDSQAVEGNPVGVTNPAVKGEREKPSKLEKPEDLL